MRNVLGFASLFVVLGFVTGCAYNPQTVALAPTVSLSPDDIGKGRQVSLEVVDERAEESLGHRGTTYGAAAEITTEQDVAAVVRDELAKGLRSHNFVPIEPDKDVPTSIKVEVRMIEYSTSTGFWSGGVHTKAAIKVICKNQGKEYRKLYRAEDEKRVVIVPTAEENSRLINQIISKVLYEVLTDNQLLQFLAS